MSEPREGLPPCVKVHEYVNLTNGLACLPHIESPRYLRLQSTWCEQKRWQDILWATPPDLFMDLATGNPLVVHDVSERPRWTRACWQGLEWIRVASSRAWALAPPEPLSERGGRAMRQYLMAQYALLPRQTKGMLRYYKRYLTGKSAIVAICSGDPDKAQAAFAKGAEWVRTGQMA